MRHLPEELERRWHRLQPISLAWIKRLKDLGVSVEGLAEPELPAQAQVVMHGDFTFDFADEADGPSADAVIFLARDEMGDSVDYVAWEPRLNRMASWWGRVALLGEDEIFAPRLDPEQALQVFETPRQWLLGERQGVCIVDPSKAPSVLRSAGRLKANSTAFGRHLHNLLTLSPPRILVPSAGQQKVA